MAHKIQHAIGSADHTQSTLADLNALISDATLQGASAVFEQEVYVSKVGNDTTGDGSLAKPYLTIKKACDSITDSLFTKRYAIFVGVGTYEEDQFTIPDFTALIGDSPTTTIINPLVGQEALTLVTMGNGTDIRSMLIAGVDEGTAVYKGVGGLAIIDDAVFADNLIGLHINDAGASVTVRSIGIVMLDALAVGVKIESGFVNGSHWNFPAVQNNLGDKAVEVINATSSLYLSGMTMNKSQISYGIHMTLGAKVEMFASSITGVSTGDRITTALYATGLTTHIHVHACSFKYCEKSIFVDEGARIEPMAVISEWNDIALEIGPAVSGTTVQMQGCSLYNNDTYDVNILASDAEMIGTGNRFNDSQVIVPTTANFNVAYLDNTLGDEGYRIAGELGVGSVEHPSESCFGQGDSTSRGMLVYQYTATPTETGSITVFAVSGTQTKVTSTTHGLSNDDLVTIAGTTSYNGTFKISNVDTDTFDIDVTFVADDATGTWSVNYYDVSTEARSADGSEWGFFSNNIGDMLYLASDLKQNGDYAQFYGVKLIVGQTALVLGSGLWIEEYWNGTAWTSYNRMMTESSAPYYPTNAVTALSTTGGSFQTRIDATIFADWATRANATADDVPLHGADEARYWTRLRLLAPVDTLPTFEQFKLHTSRTEINDDGSIEYFGNAAPVKALPINVTSLNAFNGSMADATVYFDNGVGMYLPDQRFNTVTPTQDATGTLFELPLTVDTSSPLKVKMSFLPVETGTNDYSLEARLSKVTPGVLGELSLTEPTSASSDYQMVPISGSWEEDTKQVVEVGFDISSYVARRANGFGDEVALTLATTTNNDFIIVDLSVNGLAWCNGGHIV